MIMPIEASKRLIEQSIRFSVGIPPLAPYPILIAVETSAI